MIPICGPDTAYFPINNPLIKNAKNTEVPLEGEEDMCIAPRATLRENINELRSQGYEVDYDNGPVTDNIPNPETQKDTPAYKPWGWYGIGRRK